MSGKIKMIKEYLQVLKEKNYNKLYKNKKNNNNHI